MPIGGSCTCPTGQVEGSEPGGATAKTAGARSARPAAPAGAGGGSVRAAGAELSAT